MVKDRLSRVDDDLNNKQRENIKEISTKLQRRYGEAGSKMIKHVMGNMGGGQELWGIQTTYPDTVRVESGAPTELVQLLASSGNNAPAGRYPLADLPLPGPRPPSGDALCGTLRGGQGLGSPGRLPPGHLCLRHPRQNYTR